MFLQSSSAQSGASTAASVETRRQQLFSLFDEEWQYSLRTNAPEFFANPEGPDAADCLELTAWSDGSFEVFNSRTQHTKRYPAHQIQDNLRSVVCAMVQTHSQSTDSEAS
jgi:hypothetical protein